MVLTRKTMATPTINLASNRRQGHRKNPRSNVIVECRRGSLGLGKNIAVSFLDISEGGVRLTVKEMLAAEQEVEVTLLGCQVGKPIKRLGKVCWAVPIESDGCCIGVEFEKRLPYVEVMRIAKP
jgi:PilZ domain